MKGKKLHVIITITGLEKVLNIKYFRMLPLDEFSCNYMIRGIGYIWNIFKC
jgi:hypothetical protein